MQALLLGLAALVIVLFVPAFVYECQYGTPGTPHQAGCRGYHYGSLPLALIARGCGRR